ncbi:MAG TPA: GNAT family N-acetyltransferase [Ornithinibacter sp.]|nr:GNAT family N-acetyltransferase [Ornithinibacter sp.]
MVTIRPAEPHDLPALARIEDAGDALFAQRFGPVDWPPASSGEERAAEPGFLLVAVEDVDEVAGFAHVLDLGGHWHLEQIAVDPTHGRRGIGAALLAGVHEEVARRGGREVTLTTYADVPWNGPWYAAHGYAVLERLPDRLRPFADAEERLGMQRHGRRVAMVRAVGPGRSG